ncbi:uncharacterized protein BDV14DRAFT_200636 [Aspergillus stella-maris]|uniref:uncharacterized protein n=1 Tax=Aspergillus stella-maris TaxID=1810926 RepID=UPI003CCCF927
MPSSASQQQLIESTYVHAGLGLRSPEQRCQYFEAHGTGTLAGDPQEGAAIHHAFFGKEPLRMEFISNGAPTDDFGNKTITNGNGENSDSLVVGSLKSVIGHTEGSAGLAGVIKATLCIENGQISPNLLFEKLNPALEPFASRLPNGALTLDDNLFNTLTLVALQTTHAAKVTGSLILDELSGPTTNLDFFILFGSLTGVVGNFKQTAYSSALGFQSSLIHGRRARGLVGSIVHPGIITGVGYMTRQGSRWVNHVHKTTGSFLLSESDLHRLFAEAILAGRPSTCHRQPDSSRSSLALVNTNPELVVGAQLNDPDENPDTYWYPNPIAWNYVDYRLKKSQAQSGTLGSGSTGPGSLRPLLQEASTLQEVMSIVSTGFIAKVRTKLFIADDIEITTSTQPSELGIDSLVAVDLRTWFARELEVDIPMLQIFGGASIEELCFSAVGKLEKGVFPEICALRDGDGKMGKEK